MLTIKIKNYKALELFNSLNGGRALKLLYVNMIGCYFIDNEPIHQYNFKALTIEYFMACFFNYILCADDHSLKTKNTNYETHILHNHSISNKRSYINEFLQRQ